MTTSKRPREDRFVRAIREKLIADYKPQHPRARIDVYRYNSVSVRVRIIDPDFARQDRTARDSDVWEILDTLPEDIREEISWLVLLTPDEVKTSLMNLEFEDPIPSRL